MGKGGKVNCRMNFKRRVRSKDIGSDDSDEDYMVDKNASDDDSEDFVESVDEYASDESFGSFLEEDEEEEEYRKVVVRSKSRKGSRSNSRNGKIRAKISRKRNRVSYEEEEEDEEFVSDDDEEFAPNDDEIDDRSKSQKGSRANARNGKIGGKISRKRNRVSYEEEEEEDEEFVNDDDDEEFAPNDDEDDDDDDHVDDEDVELAIRKRSKNTNLGKKTNSKRGLKRPQTKRRKSRVAKKPIGKGGTKRRLKKNARVEREDDEYEGDFIDDNPVSVSGTKRRNCAVSSDSEFVLSSNDDYTISEEEREQVREASKLLLEEKANSRSSSFVKKIQEDGNVCQKAKSTAKKGKEKLKEVKPDMGKQVCGICLSEENKRRFRGSLDCCSHYFCFTCIMEWSKVESRCPLCKQRFKTITKNGRAASAIGLDLRNVVIEVPKRDQVYHPSEEEIRSFIDPYENVICTECREGGDDGLMLLCDLCDSPAHTYCVGLGQQVPEGNWYCEGCRPVALGSSSSQSQDRSPNQFTTSSIFITPSPAVTNPVAEPSPRLPAGDIQAASGTGAPTLSMRRQLHRHIQNILSNNGIFNMPASNPRSETASQSLFLDQRLRSNDYPSSSLQNSNLLSLRTGQLRGQNGHYPTTTTSERSVNLTLWPELSAMNAVSSHGQFHQYNRPEISLSHNIAGEESQFYVVKEQLQSMVKSHLKSLSQDIELGNDTLKEITRSSTHTILAACGLEHKRSEVQMVPGPSICCHGDRLIAGQTSIMRGFCSSCFDSFARDVVRRIMDMRLPPGWLSLGL